jgi:hypothetical protein
MPVRLALTRGRPPVGPIICFLIREVDGVPHFFDIRQKRKPMRPRPIIAPRVIVEPRHESDPVEDFEPDPNMNADPVGADRDSDTLTFL